MRIESLALVSVISAIIPAAAMARESDIFAGLDVFGGIASGVSDTRDGGGNPPLFNGDGVVDNVKFGETLGIGGHIGYRIDPAWSAFIGYRHIRGDVRWQATYPSFGVASDFDGTATGDAVMGNLAYKFPLSGTTAARARTGIGVTFNRLSGVVETDKASGQFVADVARHTKASPIAEIGLGLEQSIAARTVITLDASVAYTGGFETGDTRSGNLA